ncbi:three-Cys-motif partner protein TcmP [Scytonema sp. PCC 10023]|uniref:three-Cys-motif partner protein TcmP n=1 Tax=Scytonema sp. PCC 10023 TaxID=1680591 RepID=UPI0039C6D9E7
MSGTQATWSADGSHIPFIDPHTKAKHQILETYLENLIYTLYGKARRGVTTFTFVDGFCGGGMYYDQDNKTEWQGSPIRFIEAIRAGYKKSKRHYDLNVKFIFIDNNPDHLACLKNYSMLKAGLGELVNGQPHEFKSEVGKLVEECEFLCGEFENLVNEIILKIDIRKGHSFFFLDPFGWTDVSMQSIRKINCLRGSEILYTYMINSIKRFVLDRDEKDKDTFNRMLEAEEYYKLDNLNNFERTGGQCYLRNESMRLFRDKGKAKYVFTFSMIPRGDVSVLYYLMHLSQKLTALEVIKESFWQENNLDYQYYFELYGHGFKTADFYEENQLELKFDITKNSEDFCLQKLDTSLGNIIRNNQDGIMFSELCHQTMECNPASKEHYTRYINLLRNEKEVEILRNGEIVKGRKVDLYKKDIIKLTRYKQLSFF